MAQSPCSFTSSCRFPLLPFLFPFTYLETLLAVIGSRPPWSQVTRKLTSPFLNPSTFPPHSKFPVPRLIVSLTTTTSWSRLLLSGTNTITNVKIVESWLHPCWPSSQSGCTPPPLYSTCMYISCYLSDNKPVLSYLSSRLLPQDNI
jgi:hypothetical protein